MPATFPHQPPTDVDHELATTDVADEGSRRALLAKGGVAAVVAAATAIGLGRTATAADSDPMLVGYPHTGANPTTMSGGTYFKVSDGTAGGFSGDPASIVGTTTVTNGAGVYGEADAVNGYGVLGVNLHTDAGFAGYFMSLSQAGTGVYGWDFNSDAAGIGVIGVSHRGTGVVGEGFVDDVRAAGTGRVTLEAEGVANPPTGASTVGTIARDPAGNLWWCATSGTPGTWRKLAGAATAGSYHPIVPVRVFDSRNSAFPASGAFAAGSSRVIGVEDGRNQTTGAVTAADAVPAGATAVTFNVTATATTAGSFLAVVPGDVSTTDVSTLNWATDGATVANGGTVKLDGSRQVRIIAGPGGTFHAIVDITGYYL